MLERSWLTAKLADEAKRDFVTVFETGKMIRSIGPLQILPHASKKIGAMA